MEEVETGAASPPLSKSSKFGSMRRSTASRASRPKVPAIDWDAQTDDESSSATGGSSSNPTTPKRASPRSATVSGSSPSQTMEASQLSSSSGPIKSPRGLLQRTFTLRRDRKGQSSPDMSGELPPASPGTGTLSKSGGNRFKTFAGLRDLGIGKRKSELPSDHAAFADATGNGSPARNRSG